MEFKYTETVKVQKIVEVDDRIYEEHSMATKIVNIILDHCLEEYTSALYSEDSCTVKSAAASINQAFMKADKILAL